MQGDITRYGAFAFVFRQGLFIEELNLESSGFEPDLLLLELFLFQLLLLLLLTLILPSQIGTELEGLESVGVVLHLLFRACDWAKFLEVWHWQSLECDSYCSLLILTDTSLLSTLRQPSLRFKLELLKQYLLMRVMSHLKELILRHFPCFKVSASLPA